MTVIHSNESRAEHPAKARPATGKLEAEAADSGRLLHTAFFERARRQPQRTALRWKEDGSVRCLSYGELAERALRMAARLQEAGAGPGQSVAIALPRGPEQVIAVLAALASGAAYVPVGVHQPAARVKRIYRLGSIRVLLTAKDGQAAVSAETDIAALTLADGLCCSPLPEPVGMAAEDLAYIIFTSGSTGEPKGVEITHAAAYNTVTDINRRFAIKETDRVLAVSALDFDLSVYDIFGLLSAGGELVLLREQERREAAVWAELVREMKVTVWNSVPALMEMLLIGAVTRPEALSSLRLALVSGDWIGLDLPSRLAEQAQACRFIALGGATEASIWSNCFEVEGVDPAWRSIPYGRPLSNQAYRVVDELGNDCAAGTPGELWIGGKGVARGYAGNPELSAERFVEHEGQRWYRTGDTGCYDPDGLLEFLGRTDDQIKLRGYRIELGEIESALRKCAGVSQAAVYIAGQEGTETLAAAVVPRMDGGGTDAGMDAGKGSRLTAAARLHGTAYGPVSSAAAAEEQSRMVEAFIAQLLSLSADSGSGERVLTAAAGQAWTEQAAPEYQPLVRLWLRWLGARRVTEERNGNWVAGPRWEEAASYARQLRREAASGPEREESVNAKNRQNSTNGANSAAGINGTGRANGAGAAAGFGARAEAHLAYSLFRRLEDYREIIKGERSSLILLDDETLSPETLSALDAGTILGLRTIADRIREQAAKDGRPVAAVLLGGRSGLLAVKLLELLAPADISLTLLDSSPGLTAAAEKRFAPLLHDVRCLSTAEDRVPAHLRYAFDVVLALHALHRYREPDRGPAVASLLVRAGGRMLALEHRELAPVALVTSAVLDQGYAEFDPQRRSAGSPLLSPGRWTVLLEQAGGFRNVRSMRLGETFAVMLEAECAGDRVQPTPEGLLAFVSRLLPPYMLPHTIDIVPWLPLTANGKVDRKALLPEPGAGRTEAAGKGELPHPGLEQAVAELWKELLGAEGFGRHDGFFASGGDSLLATRFLSEVSRRYGVNLALRQLFDAPALEQVAAALAAGLKEAEDDAGDMEEGEI